jgi:septal ring factor EnvC (AmiA/AmiB activator)
MTYLFVFVQLHKQSLELRTYHEHLSIEQNKNTTNEHEHQQLRSTIQSSKDQIENLQHDFHQTRKHNEQLEYTINELSSRNNLNKTNLKIDINRST